MNVRTTIESSLALTASAVRHVGWWLDWHSRSRPSRGSRPADERVL